jgi:hypothetical protein
MENRMARGLCIIIMEINMKGTLKMVSLMAIELCVILKNKIPFIE